MPDRKPLGQSIEGRTLRSIANTTYNMYAENRRDLHAMADRLERLQAIANALEVLLRCHTVVITSFSKSEIPESHLRVSVTIDDGVFTAATLPEALANAAKAVEAKGGE